MPGQWKKSRLIAAVAACNAGKSKGFNSQTDFLIGMKTIKNLLFHFIYSSPYHSLLRKRFIPTKMRIRRAI